MIAFRTWNLVAAWFQNAQPYRHTQAHIFDKRAEFGAVCRAAALDSKIPLKNPEQFAALYAYSPYHHVVDGTRYPAVLMLTGDHDDGRVNPFHSRKMIARLQAANKSTHPILLRTTSAAGHGMGTALDERIAQEAGVFAFLFDELGMK